MNESFATAGISAVLSTNRQSAVVHPFLSALTVQVGIFVVLSGSAVVFLVVVVVVVFLVVMVVVVVTGAWKNQAPAAFGSDQYPAVVVRGAPCAPQVVKP